MACPDMELTLLDSLDKRIGFLRDTCALLGFDDVRCIHARAEEAPAELHAGFDIAYSRAVARLNLLCELCLPLAKKGGVFIAMKGPDCADELNAAKRAIKLLRRRGGGREKIPRPRHRRDPQRHHHPQDRRHTRKISPPLGADQKTAALKAQKILRKLSGIKISGVLSFEQPLKLVDAIDDDRRARVQQRLAATEAPAHADAGQPRIARGLDVHLGVSDVDGGVLVLA
ncbi:MAG: RsmG family class I SAM-dependent methyltransferase [Oscillospiraceae bacterium]